MKPKRVDTLEETWSQFIKNMLWGDLIVDNSYVSLEICCGVCGMRSKVNCREKDKIVRCTHCGMENELDLKAWGW